MRRINSGLYTERRTVIFDGKPVEAEFRVFKIKAKDPNDPKKTKELPLWSYDCASLKILARDVYEKKMEAMNALDQSCRIGFKTVPIHTTMLAVEPS